MFDKLPKLIYNPNFNVNNDQIELVSDIFFRAKFREAVKNENIDYFLYTVRDGDTPESIAGKYYGDPKAHWVILFANDIVDPYYDWPLSQKNFNAYIKEKYGSITSAQTTVHHYEKIVTTTDSRTGTVTTRHFVIDETDARDTAGETLPYEAYDELAVDSHPSSDSTFRDGGSVQIVISRASVTQYDWELALNEEKQNIRLIHANWYPKLKREFETMIAQNKPYYRNIRSY